MSARPLVMNDVHALNRNALDPARSVVVEACAGSGKTWLLVSRILRLLLAGAQPGDILAITFTRKAAQEMAARLREWLYDLATLDDGKVREMLAEREVLQEAIATLMPRARGLYERVLTAQPSITITTFHSWFMQLLRCAPLAAGALGSTTLVEQTSTLVAEAWERFALRLQRGGDPAAPALDYLFGECGLSNTQTLLRRFVQRRADWWSVTDAADSASALARMLDALRDEFGVNPDLDPRAVLLEDRSFIAQLNEYAGFLARNTATDQRKAARLAQDLLHAEPAHRFDAVCGAVLRAKGEPWVRKSSEAQRGRLRDVSEDRFLALHSQLTERLVETCDAWRDVQAYRLNAAALTCGVALLEAYQQVKRDAQAIDYDDIEWRAYRLLSVSEHATWMQYKLDARYRHILLDEFQDTNPLQWLTLKAWLAAAVEAGSQPSVFVVGDPKQSIYRFRRAEARLFQQAAEYLAAEYGAVRVPQNETRRCAAAIVRVADELFTNEGANYAGYERHSVHYPAKPGRVEVLPLAANDAGAATRPVPAELRNPLLTPLALEEDVRREREAQQLVEGIRRIVDTWQVAVDVQGTTFRPAAYSDIMLLVRQRTHLEAYERALRHAGIPYVTSRQGGLLDTLEARDLTALLEFLVAPFSDLQLAHVLRSPIFSCADSDLMLIAQSGPGTWWERLCRVVREARDVSPALRRAHRLLARWLELADTLPVHDQLDRIYFDGGIVERYMAAVPQASRESVRANLHAFIQRGLETGAGRYPSLPRFLAQLEELRAAPAEEAPDEGVVSEAGAAVRILTVHGAKGLEAPVVWLLDAAASSRTGGYDMLVDWSPEERAPRHFSVWSRESALSRAQRGHFAQEALIAEREDLNLLYVAITRAKQALIVSGSDGRNAGNGWYARIRRAVVAVSGSDGENNEPVTYGADLSRGVAAPATGTPLRAPDITAALRGPMPTGMRVPFVSGAGVRYGTCFHRLMDGLTCGVSQDNETLRRELGLTRAEFELMSRQANALLDKPELSRFFDPRQFIRGSNEVPYAGRDGELRRIDRLVEFAGEVWVLDYKTGTMAGDTALMLEYRTQLAEYREAMQSIFPDKRVHALLIFADGCTTLES